MKHDILDNQMLISLQKLLVTMVLEIKKAGLQSLSQDIDMMMVCIKKNHK